jgi:hypothetical protein
MDHSIVSLTPVTLAEVDRERFEVFIASDRSLAEGFWCETLSNAAIQREWTMNLGRRDALERVAHLLCEIVERLRPVGLWDGHSCAFPVTQLDLADATGLSVVHVNRTLQELRSSGLIVLRDRTRTINNLDALKRAAMFNPDYLHYVTQEELRRCAKPCRSRKAHARRNVVPRQRFPRQGGRAWQKNLHDSAGSPGGSCTSSSMAS